PAYCSGVRGIRGGAGDRRTQLPGAGEPGLRLAVPQPELQRGCVLCRAGHVGVARRDPCRHRGPSLAVRRTGMSGPRRIGATRRRDVGHSLYPVMAGLVPAISIGWCQDGWPGPAHGCPVKFAVENRRFFNVMVALGPPSTSLLAPTKTWMAGLRRP